MGISSTTHDLRALIQSFHPVIAIDTVEEERAEQLVRTVGDELSLPVWEWTVTQGLLRAPGERPHLSTAPVSAALGHIRGLMGQAIYLLKDFAGHLADPVVRREFRDTVAALGERNSTIVITGVGHEFPQDVAAEVVHYALNPPSRDELREVVRGVVDSLTLRTAANTGNGAADLEAVLTALAGMTANQARQAVADAIVRDGILSGEDVPHLLTRKAEVIGQNGLLEYFPAEDNVFELGGFDRLEAWLTRAKIGFSDDARDLNLPAPRGILMVGVQGCGKSLAAKYVARAWGLPLLKLDAGRLFSKWIGESESNMRRAITLAESMAPAVLWVDEIEKAFSGLGGSDTDGGTTGRMFATFLSWLQEREAEVFVVATANDVFRLPPELMRKGRFDEIFFVDLPGADERTDILEIHLRRRKQDPSAIDVAAIAAATEGFSGAELEQAVIASLYDALHRESPLSTNALLGEIARTVPLSRSRREDIDRLRALAQERFVPVT